MTDLDTPISTVDLHTHTTASDGIHRPAELVALAARRGLRFLGLTDHDTTAGVPEAVVAGDQLGVAVIPGVELGADVPAGEVHVLGYFLNHEQPELQQTLARFRQARQTRAARMVEQLAAIGLPVDLEQVERLAAGGAITRAHVARVLVEAGVVDSIDDAFTRYLNPGRAGYVPRARLSPRESVELIRSAGGAPVLAHPYSVADLVTLLPELVSAGLAGLEAFYGSYTREQHQKLLALATQFRLIPTGGSDFHGLGEREGRNLGSIAVPEETVDRLRQATRGLR